MNQCHRYKICKFQEHSIHGCRDIHEKAFSIDLLAHIPILAYISNQETSVTSDV